MFQRGNIAYYSNINVSNSGMWQSISLIKYGMDNLAEHSLTKLMVSCDLLRLMVTNQVAFEQWDLHLTYEFEQVINFRHQALVSKLETLHAITFTKLSGGLT